MTNLIAFTTEEELSKLTGLSHEELWDNGFDIDDLDGGIQLDKKMDCYNLWWLERALDNYCVGYVEVEYKGKYYYMVYHA